MYEYNINDNSIHDQAVPLRELSQEESAYSDLKDSEQRVLLAIAKSPLGIGTQQLADVTNLSRPYATEVGNRLVKMGRVSLQKLLTKPKETSIYLLSPEFDREKTVAVGEALIQRQQSKILPAKDRKKITDFEELQSVFARGSITTKLVYWSLAKNKGKTVKELEEELEKSGSFINVSLLELIDYGLVIRQRESKAYVYYLAPDVPEEQHQPIIEDGDSLVQRNEELLEPSPQLSISTEPSSDSIVNVMQSDSDCIQTSTEQCSSRATPCCTIGSAKPSDSSPVEHKQEPQQQIELQLKNFMESKKPEAPSSSGAYEEQSEASNSSGVQVTQQVGKSAPPATTFEDKVWNVLKHLVKELADIKGRITELEKGRQRASAYDEEEILKILDLDDSD